MDIDRVLNLEKRTGIKDSDIDDFTRKASDIEAAIKGLMAGTLDPKDIKIEGIETEEEIQEKEIKREKIRQEQKEKAEKLAAQRKHEERERWWAGVEYFVSNQRSNASVTDEDECKESVRNVSQKYSMDYSRWDIWTPQDPVTREERERQEAEEDRKRNEEFEKANPEFCDQFLADKAERDKAVKKKETSADVARLKGNRHFQRKEYDLALGNYMEALKLLPYDVKTLTNIAQVVIKQLKYDDALEFLSRTLHIDPNHVKALSRKAYVLNELNQPIEALAAVQAALKVEPQNNDLLIQARDLEAIVRESVDEAKLKELIKVQTTTLATSDTNRVQAKTEESAPLGNQQPQSESKLISAATTSGSGDVDASICLLNACIKSMVIVAQEILNSINQSNLPAEVEGVVSSLSCEMTEEAMMLMRSLSLTGSEAAAPKISLGTALLNKFAMLKVYMRTSAILKSVVLVILRSVFDTIGCIGLATISNEFISFGSDMAAFVCAAIRGERTSKLQVVESQSLAIAMKFIMNGDGILTKQEFLRHILALISVCAEDDVCPKSQKLVHTNRPFLLRTGGILGELSLYFAKLSYVVTPSSLSQTEIGLCLSVVLQCCEIILSFTTSVDGKITISANEDVGTVVLALSGALFTTWQKKCGFQSSEVTISVQDNQYFDDVIEKLVEVSLVLSQFESLRKFFAIGIPAMDVVVLQAKSRPSGSGSGAGAVISSQASNADAVVSVISAMFLLMRAHSIHTVNCLAVVINACLDPENVVKAEVERLGGVELAIDALQSFHTTAVVDEDSELIRNRYAALISRLVTSENVRVILSSSSTFKMFCQELRWAMSAYQERCILSPDRIKWRKEEVGHLIRIVAGLVKPSPEIRELAIQEDLFGTVVSLLPTPRMELGAVTPASVILPPVEMASPLLLGNAARVLLQYADDQSCASVMFGLTGSKVKLAVEKLICTMASCSDIRVRKNIAIVLAKGSRLPLVREKVQLLRGMQMIVELQDKLT